MSKFMEEWDECLKEQQQNLRVYLDKSMEQVLFLAAHMITVYKMRAKALEEENIKLKEQLNGRPDTPDGLLDSHS